MMDDILRELQQPEYLHVLLNPLPLYGLGVALFGLIAATYFRSRPAQVTALVLIFATAISAWPVTYHGDRAYDRVLSMADDPGQAWLKAHVHRADQWIYLYYALAALAGAAIFVPKKWPRWSTPLIIATMVLSMVSLGVGTYISHAAGKIRHREFRSGPPPKTEPEPR